MNDSDKRFAIGTFEASGTSFPGLVVGERVFDLTLHLGPTATVRRMLEDWDPSLACLRDLASNLGRDDADHTLSKLPTLPPVQPFGQIFQAGANYLQHVIDLMAGAERRGDQSDGLGDRVSREMARAELEERARSGTPFVFLGSGHAVIGANDDVVLPFDSEQSDWEIELAAVIGRPARRVARDRALEVVAGYTICNDLTSRDALNRPDTRSLGIDWLAGKNSPTFLPTGPLLVPAEFVPDPMNLHLELTVNGHTMQDESTADMLFDVATLIEHISSIAELRPGDLVLTGSPAGNGSSHGVFLRPGDVIEAKIEGLSSQRNLCVPEHRTNVTSRTVAAGRAAEGDSP